MANKIVALVGPHASGKSMIIQKLAVLGINFLPIYTTKNIEESATADKDIYHTIEKMEFFRQDFICKFTYKGDYYGILKTDVFYALNNYPITMTILPLSGVKQFSALQKDSFETIYIMCDYVTLVERMIAMGGTNADIKYHLEYADNNKEFEDWKVTTFVVKNVSTPERAISQILTILGLTKPASPDEIRALTGKIE